MEDENARKALFKRIDDELLKLKNDLDTFMRSMDIDVCIKHNEEWLTCNKKLDEKLIKKYELVLSNVMHTCKLRTIRDFQSFITIKESDLYLIREKLNDQKKEALDPVQYSADKNKKSIEDEHME